MLQVEPCDKIIFSEQQNTAEVIIRNVAKELVTFKLQSTVYGKFRMRPRCGRLAPDEHVHVTIELEKDKELSQLGRDRIQVLCIQSPVTQLECVLTADFWRFNSCYHPLVEKHQLICYMQQPVELAMPSSKEKKARKPSGKLLKSSSTDCKKKDQGDC